MCVLKIDTVTLLFLFLCFPRLVATCEVMFVQEQNAQTKERLGVEDLIGMLPNLMTYRGWAKK